MTPELYHILLKNVILFSRPTGAGFNLSNGRSDIIYEVTIHVKQLNLILLTIGSIDTIQNRVRIFATSVLILYNNKIAMSVSLFVCLPTTFAVLGKS